MKYTIKENQLNYETYYTLRKSVGWNNWSKEQAEKALENSYYSIVIFYNDNAIGMGRVVGDGIYFIIVDVVVRPEYQGKGIGKMLINELRRFINDNGVKGTDIFVELCAVPDKIPFYEKFGFEANEAQRLKIYHHVE